ncbi:MAG: ABC transporter permease subunit [Buchananella hordeovulneris]|nr:ABC transporter permease subunit [Buchananella hordeovulneris]
MALINALGLYGIFTAWAVESWVIAGTLVVGLVVVDYIYFSGKRVPAKYLVPGLIFLLVYQVFVMAYTGYVAFTNYGTGHNSTKEDAIAAILMQNEVRQDGAESVPAAVVERDGVLGLAVLEDGKLLVGDAQSPAEVVAEDVTAERITEVPGARILSPKELSQRQTEVTDLRVLISADPTAPRYKTETGSVAYLAVSRLQYDADADTITNPETGVVYSPNENGSFADPDGNELSPGWRVTVGFKNFTAMLADSRLAGPFLSSVLWTFSFAVLSVLTTFALGLVLAVIFNDPRVKGRVIYRSLLILPYAFPAFLSALVWRGMMNEEFGFLNQVLLGGASIPWLSDPLMAKVSILLVNLWLGFPYMFLVCTGALQSVPSDIYEAARIDGAGPLRMFRSITLPLVLVATTPLLIASFAFNFNNFSLIYMLTGGGPLYQGLPYSIGKTDILISMVYAIAFEGGSQQYGLASALSIMIFIVVGIVSWLSFRAARTLEEV